MACLHVSTQKFTDYRADFPSSHGPKDKGCLMYFSFKASILQLASIYLCYHTLLTTYCDYEHSARHLYRDKGLHTALQTCIIPCIPRGHLKKGCLHMRGFVCASFDAACSCSRRFGCPTAVDQLTPVIIQCSNGWHDNCHVPQQVQESIPELCRVLCVSQIFV